MTGYRDILHRHRTGMLLLMVLALLARMLIPTGYMPIVQDGRFVMMLCPGQGAMPMAMPVVHDAMAGMDHAAVQPGHPAGHDGPGHIADGPCAFAGIALAATTAVDPLVLALTIVFVMAAVFRPAQWRPSAPLRFAWPPRTGPPLTS